MHIWQILVLVIASDPFVMQRHILSCVLETVYFRVNLEIKEDSAAEYNSSYKTASSKSPDT